MSKKTVIFNVGGTTFEIKKDSFDAYPNSSLYKLVNRSSSSSSFSSRFSSNKSSTQTIFLDHNPFAFSVILDYIRYKRLCIPKNVTREIVELQLREFGLGDDIKLSDKSSSEIEDDLPSYEQALNGFSASDGIALKDAAMLAVFRRIDTLISDVILPYLNRHAKRGHQQVTFYLTPNIITKNITTELEHINDPHEWVQLSTSSSSVDKDDSLKNDLPDLQFLLQKRETLDQLRDLIISKSGVKKCTVNKVEISHRSENEFGLFSSKSCDIVQIFVTIV